MSFFTTFRKLFPKKKLIYTAFGNEQYFNIISKLKSNGIKHSTKFQVNMTRDRNFNNDRYKPYDIYVKEEDVNKALEAIHNR